MNDRHARLACDLNGAPAVGQHQTTVVIRAELAYPTVEQLQCIRTRPRLRQQVLPHDLRQLLHQLRPEVRFAHHQALGMYVVATAAALNRIASQRKRRAAEADQRQAAIVKLPPRQLDRLQREPEAFLGRCDPQRGDVAGSAHRVVDQRPLALDELQAQAHPLQRRQDVGKDDSGVQIERVDRLHGDLAGQLRRLDQFEDGVAFAQRAVLGHVAAGLAHQPDRRCIHRLAAAGAQEATIRQTVVLIFLHGCHRGC